MSILNNIKNWIEDAFWNIRWEVTSRIDEFNYNKEIKNLDQEIDIKPKRKKTRKNKRNKK